MSSTWVKVFSLLLIIILLRWGLVLSVSPRTFNDYKPEIRSFKPKDDGIAARSESFILSLLKTGISGKFSYTLGQRIVGDRIISQLDGGENYPTARDVEVILKYPESGTGSILTHVTILVDQTTSVGGAYVLKGGINDRFIEILVVANGTTRFLYSAAFYGY